MKSFAIPFIIVLIIISAGVLYPSWKDLGILKTEFTKLQTDLETKTADLKKLAAQEAEDAAALGSLARSIPQYLDQAEIIRDISKITRQYSFSFDSIQFSKGVQASSNTPELTIAFNASGAAEKITPVLKAFEQNDPFVGLKRLQVSIDSTSDLTPQANLGLALYTLSLR